MKIAPLAEVKNQLSDYIRQSAAGPVIITRKGKPAAMLIAITDEDDLEALIISHNKKLRGLLNKIITRLDKEGGLEEEAFWQEVEQMPAKAPLKRPKGRARLKR